MALSRISLRQIGRRLFRSPVFTAVVVVTLALGIGANAAIFSVIDAVLLKPLPYPQPDALVGMWHTAAGLPNLPELNQSPSNYFTYREENQTLEDMGLYRGGGGATVTGLAEPQRVDALYVTDGILPILRIQPQLGRWFSRKDDLPGSPQTTILSYGYWQSTFGGDRSVLGRRILVDGAAHEIIGVMPAGFRFMDNKFSLILPLRIDRAKVFVGNFSYRGLARMKPGITIPQVNTDVARMLPLVPTKFPPPPGFTSNLLEQAHIGPKVRPLLRDVIGDIDTILWMLMGTVGVVLLIACANAANLLLVRGEARQQELAIRAALGAGWNQIAAELLSESVVLGLAGGACGLGLAWAGLKLLLALAPQNVPRLDQIAVGAATLWFTLAISVGASLLFGLIPALRYAALRPDSTLRQGGRSFSQGRERHRIQNILVTAQIGLALVLVTGSGLMIRTFRALKQQAPGFTRPEELQTFRLVIPETQVKDPEQVARADEEILARLSHIPGVLQASLASNITMDGFNSNDIIFAEDRAYSASELPPIRRFKFIAPGFFKTMGNPLVAGRDITWTDIHDLRPVAIISENFAREYWGSPTNALGKRIRDGLKDEWREIVGVVGNELDDGAHKKAPTVVYWPILLKQFFAQDRFVARFSSVALRTLRAGSEQLLNEVRQAVRSVNPDLPIAQVFTVDQIARKSMARISFTLVMLAIAGGMALLLGMIGVYGVIAYSVSQRRREIGIRTALGAQESELTGLFVYRGLRLAAAGVALGLAGAVASTRLMKALLFGVSTLDPATYGSVAAMVILAAILASYLPSRRAARGVPLEALAAE